MAAFFKRGHRPYPIKRRCKHDKCSYRCIVLATFITNAVMETLWPGFYKRSYNVAYITFLFNLSLALMASALEGWVSWWSGSSSLLKTGCLSFATLFSSFRVSPQFDFIMFSLFLILQNPNFLYYLYFFDSVETIL